MINYKKAGFNTLNEMFDKMVKCQAENDHKGFIKLCSKLSLNQKVAFIEHSKGLEVFAGAMKDLVTECCGGFKVSKAYMDCIIMALNKVGYIITEQDNSEYAVPEIKFTDGQLIEGTVRVFEKEVSLQAVDAKERIYNKIVTFLGVEDLIESINHFKHDIEETFQEVEVPEITEDIEPVASLSDNEISALAKYLNVEPKDISTDDGETYHSTEDSKEYKVSEKPLDLKDYKQDTFVDNNEFYYIYWK